MSTAPAHRPSLPAGEQAQLVATGVRLRRGPRVVLDGLDLTVIPTTRLGVVGENGRGKTSLLGVLSGALAPDAGTVRRTGTLAVVDQELPVPVEATVGDLLDLELAAEHAAVAAVQDAARALAAGAPGADEAYARALADAQTLDAWDADRRVDLALQALGAVTDRSRVLATLSVGQRYRVRLACLLGTVHDLLLLDEPTNHLDAAGLAHLGAALREFRGGVVLVSHDRKLLGQVADTVLDLDPSRDGRPRWYGGGLAGWRAGRTAERSRWLRDHQEQLAEHARLGDDLARARSRLVDGWRPEKGTGKHTRATRAPGLVRSVHRRQEDLDRHRVDVPEPPLMLSVPELPALPGAELVRAQGVTVAGRLPRPVDVALGSGDRLVVRGPNGAGKSTLLQVLAGDLVPDAGSRTAAPGLRIGLLAQEGPRPDPRPAQEVYEQELVRLVLAGRLAESEVLPLSELGLLDARDRQRPAAELSAGQRRRLDLARVLAARPHLLLLDEPTNHLSMALVDELTEALAATAAAVVLTTHDRQLLRDTKAWPRLVL
ncbi:ATP-binding cassette domain-containing protein [Kocuria sediminis]|uniref:ATP-binding cassette domain-containing protein n=1 Tax=Kocuria sediminis TaxID=1038857 RepID=A0A6N8GRE8_9MICC|nr:ATP-binding cassette domain-containing protein [Kocuria sediminis]MUN64840.1 ATP-binding cassette domain-containing protein [Kocuria sediminis]